MVSLDQVLLLGKRVESAVQKIAQLNTENDALRKKCAELTNALSEKTKQLSAFETDQAKIEEGILKALDRLNSVENSVLKAAGQHSEIQNKTSSPTAPVQEESFQNELIPASSDSSVQSSTVIPSPIQESDDNQPHEQKKDTPDTSGQFDIF